MKCVDDFQDIITDRKDYDRDYFGKYLELKKEYNDLIDWRMNNIKSMNEDEVYKFEYEELQIRKRITKLKNEYGVFGAEKPQALKLTKTKYLKMGVAV